MSSVRADVIRKYSALLNRLIAYCAERHGVRWSQEDAERALTAYLHERSVPILAALTEGTPIPPPDRRQPGNTYLVNAFIEHIYRTDPDAFEFLEAVVKGSMLANVLVFPELGSVQRRFGRLAAYFDTPFLLHSLGCEGPEKEAAALEVLNLLFEQGVDLKVFEHTFDEILGVLHAAAHALRAQPGAWIGYGPVIEYCLTSGRTASDLELLIANLRQRLQARHVHIAPKPAVTVELSVDERQLEELLRNEVRYRSEDALRHDWESLTAVYRLRRGRRPRDIESCGALFVTTNEALARASTQALATSEEDAGIPLCLLDTVLATLAWLKKPSASPELPRKMLVAACYAALQPPDDLWQLYLEEARRLRDAGEISAEDFIQLRVSTVAKSELMARTRGDPLAVTTKAVRDIVRASRQAILAEREPEIEQERQLRREAVDRLRQDHERAEARIRNQHERIRSIAARVAGFVGLVVAAVAVIVVGLVLIVANIGYPTVALPWRIVINAVVVCLALGSLVWGMSIRRARRVLEARLATFVERRLWRILGD